MKKLLIAGLAGLSLVAANAHADPTYRGLGSQYTINAGSGIVVNSSALNRRSVDTYSYDRHNRYDRDDRNRNRHDRDRDGRNHRDRHDGYRNSSGTTVWLRSGNISVSYGDLSYGRPSYRDDYRHDNGLHLGHEHRERRQGKYLKDRYGNCYKVEGSSRNERRVRVRDSRCRF